MNITYPHTIQNCLGEKLIFKALQPEPDGDRLLVENFVTPGNGPVMHTHYLQDECLTVLEGTIGYQVQGEEEQFAGPGETVLFERGTPHRFWNAGTNTLHCTGWVKPANTLVFFLTAIYDAQNKSGKAQPEPFDAAYLLTRYHKEYAMNELPAFVKKAVIPATYLLGQFMGKYKKFEDAPKPVIV
jgi:quercetin dioxygenase-like cupin family protein